MKTLTLSALVGLVILLTLAVGILVHRACSINLSASSIVGECFKPSLISKQSEVEQRSYISLLAEIEGLERELVLKTCSKKDTKPGMDEGQIQRWEEQDISVLSNCWKLLGDEYRTVSIKDPTKVTIFNEWKMCFDSSGNGEQELTGTNAPICRGKIKAKFISDKTLIISDLKDVSCDNRRYIIRREATCKLNKTGIAECLVSQPDSPKSNKSRSKVYLQQDITN